MSAEERRFTFLSRHSPRRYRNPNRPNPYSLRIPHRWTDYQPVGQTVEGTRFVAFKTPLGARFFGHHRNDIGPSGVFQTSTVLDHAKKQGKELGLVIDLTATDRYYDSNEWVRQGVCYEKIRCEGHSAHSQQGTALRFCEVVARFLAANADNDKLIGVHCTHGLNRTGYLICRYLVEVEGWQATTAIQRFETSRGYKIERAQYVQSLQEDCTRGSKAHLVDACKKESLADSDNQAGSDRVDRQKADEPTRTPHQEVIAEAESTPQHSDAESAQPRIAPAENAYREACS